MNLETTYINIHKDLIESCKKGKSKAQYEIYKLYSKAMFNVCYRMLNNFQEAEDMLQEGFTDAFNKIDSFRYESAFGAWLKRIFVNKCINENKRKKIKLEFDTDTENHELVYQDQEDDKPRFNIDEIKSAVNKISEGGRIIFNLYLLEGYDHSEISQILNISESTSKSQLLRAKQKVRDILLQKN